MGLGMQRWIYTQMPRRPFSKKRRQVGDTNYRYSVDGPNISGRTHTDRSSNKDRQEILHRISRRAVNNKITSVIIIISIFIITTVILINYKPWITSLNAEHTIHEKQQKELAEKTHAYEFAMSYGKHFLKSGDYELAIVEFHNANRVFPDNKEAMDLLVMAYVQNCIANGNNCEKAETILDMALKKHPEDYNYLSYEISLMNFNN